MTKAPLLLAGALLATAAAAQVAPNVPAGSPLGNDADGVTQSDPAQQVQQAQRASAARAAALARLRAQMTEDAALSQKQTNPEPDAAARPNVDVNAPDSPRQRRGWDPLYGDGIRPSWSSGIRPPW